MYCFASENFYDGYIRFWELQPFAKLYKARVLFIITPRKEERKKRKHVDLER